MGGPRSSKPQYSSKVDMMAGSHLPPHMTPASSVKKPTASSPGKIKTIYPERPSVTLTKRCAAPPEMQITLPAVDFKEGAEAGDTIDLRLGMSVQMGPGAYSLRGLDDHQLPIAVLWREPDPQIQADLAIRTPNRTV